MNARMITFLAAAAVAVAATLTPAVSGPPVGEKAPDFSLPSIEGETQALEYFRGSIVVLEWINHDCPFVRKFYTTGNMQELQKKYSEKNVVWLSICSSAPGKQGHFSIEEWQRRQQKAGANPTAVLLDEDGKVGRAYNARTTPHMFVIDAEGILRYKGGIDDRPQASAASLEGARNYVVEALDALLAGEPVALTESRPYGCSVKYAE